jgi:hypothetical protein
MGRKAFFLICLALFTASSVLCGIAWTLQSLLLFRIMQGLAGGGMVPVASSILVDAFPPEKLYGGLGTGELRRLKQLEEENRKLKQLVADLSLDKHILQDVLSKKL